MSSGTLRVALGGMSPLYSAGLAAMFAGPGRGVVIERDVSDLELTSVTWDLVVLDLTRGARLGAAHLHALWRRRVPALALLAGTDGHGPGTASHALGFRGAVDVRASTAEVRAAVLEAVRAAPPTSLLTLRELQVLHLIARGHTNQDIGRELLIGENTVKTYVRLAYRKIGVTTRAQAARWGGLNVLSSDTASLVLRDADAPDHARIRAVS